MPDYCDVALPVPLDRVFTYAAGDLTPVVGGRVLVPFRNEKLAGVVVQIHDEPPRRADSPGGEPLFQQSMQLPVLQAVHLETVVSSSGVDHSSSINRAHLVTRERDWVDLRSECQKILAQLERAFA